MKRLIAVILLLLTLSACAPTKQTKGAHSLDYRIVEIEGMPCVWIKATGQSNSYAGLSCDWSKWEGK